MIQDDSQTYFACRKPSADRTLLQQRRVERLKEIKDELDHLLRIHRRGAACNGPADSTTSSPKATAASVPPASSSTMKDAMLGTVPTSISGPANVVGRAHNKGNAPPRR